MAAPPHNPNNDYEVPSPPTDGISCMSFSPVARIFVAGSWDNQVRCWEVQGTSTGIWAVPKVSMSHEGPVLCTAFSVDGMRVFSGGCDNKAKCWTLGQQPVQIGQHAAPIKTIHCIDELNVVATGSWDKTIKYWDGRSPTPAADVPVPERVYAMDVNFPLMVCATAERLITVYDVRQPTVEYKRIQSPLKYQSRCISAFPDKTGFALGSIEGRCAIHHVEDRDQQRNFTFKCHRDGNNVFAVNSIAFNKTFGTFSTTGSDGVFNFWDKDSKQRLKPFLKCPQPIPAGVFSHDTSLFAYAVSYDWSKGSTFYNPHTMKNLLFIHVVQEAEVKNRAPRR